MDRGVHALNPSLNDFYNALDYKKDKRIAKKVVQSGRHNAVALQ